MQVIVTPKAQKHYENLSENEQKKIKKKLGVLQNNPLAGKKLAGIFAEQRVVRAWPYRITYYISGTENKLYITAIQHRQGAYK